MAEQKYLVGTRGEKLDVERLLCSNLPGNSSFEFAYLCNSLIERLQENGCECFTDFDHSVAEYLYEFKTELQERSKQYENEFEEYLRDIENALGLFKYYLLRLELFPLPDSIWASEATPGTVLLLTVNK